MYRVVRLPSVICQFADLPSCILMYRNVIIHCDVSQCIVVYPSVSQWILTYVMYHNVYSRKYCKCRSSSESIIRYRNVLHCIAIYCYVR